MFTTTGLLALTFVALVAINASAQPREENPAPPAQPNVVLVHGAFADGSSWGGVIERLQADGYTVTAVQLPLTSLADDIALTRAVLVNQTGPTILVGHSYAGAVITALGPDAPNVVGLIYVAAFAPDEGETVQALASAEPPAAGAAAIRPDASGFLWLDPDGFLQYFAPDVPRAQARVMAAVQKPIATASLLNEEPLGPPSWRSLPSWYLVAEDDQMIPAAAQHAFANRAGATVSSVASSHVPMVSHPDAVADLIVTAAQAVTEAVAAGD